MHVPLCHYGRNCEIGKKLGRNGSHCATSDEFACREKFGRGGSHFTTREELERKKVPLYHYREELERRQFPLYH